MHGLLSTAAFPEPRLIVIYTLIAVGGVAVSLGLALLILVRLPADYFCGRRRGASTPRTPGRILKVVAKNIAGIIIIALGIVLSIPGVPGQGILTVLAGLILVDFPGKYRLERAVLRRPTVSRFINRLRVRLGRPPLLVPEDDAT